MMTYGTCGDEASALVRELLREQRALKRQVTLLTTAFALATVAVLVLLAAPDLAGASRRASLIEVPLPPTQEVAPVSRAEEPPKPVNLRFHGGAFGSLFAGGVRLGDTCAMAGQVSVTDDGEIVGEGDVSAQVHQAYVNVKAVLEGLELTGEAVYEETWYVVAGEMENVMVNHEKMAASRKEILGQGFEEISITLIGVAALYDPKALIEIKPEFKP